LPAYPYGADALVAGNHGRIDDCLGARKAATFADLLRYVRAAFHVGKMGETTSQTQSAGFCRHPGHICDELLAVRAMVGLQSDRAVGLAHGKSERLSLEQPRTRGKNGIEHRPCVFDGTADHTQDFRGGLLMIERFLRLVEEPN